MFSRLRAYWFLHYRLHWTKEEAWFGSKSMQNEIEVVRRHAGIYEE